ncbi:MAG: NTP transferase domain-containing protein [Woeseiaceae bacterium]|nr:NTP transferase domain-containing protein [Woeseiaceae bacterium]
MSRKRPLFGLVLAGGRSRRMGQDKALLDRDGQSQLAFAMSAVASVTELQFVSTRADQQEDAERSRYAQIVDRYDDLGPVAGVLSAMDEYPEVDWLVVACDLPNLDEATLTELVDSRAEDAPFTAYRSSYDELPEPLCAIYPAESHAILRGFVDEGLKCPRKMLIRSETQLLAQPNPAALDNVNTPDDLAGSVLKANG